MGFLNIIAFVCFATSLFMRSTDPVVPQIAGDLGVAASTVALLATAFALPYATVQPVLGALADVVSKTKLMTLCLVVLVLATVVAAMTTSFPLLVATRVIAGIAAGGVFPIALAIAGDRVPVARRQVAIGRLLAAAMIGNLLGASGAGALGDLFGWRSVFVATSLVGIAVLALAVFGFRGIHDEPAGKFDLPTLGGNYRAIFGNPLAKFCFATVFLEAMFIFGVFPHMASMLRAGGEERASIAGVVLAGFGIGAILYTLLVSRLLPWAGTRRLMLAGGVVMASCLVVIGLRLPWPVEFINFIILGCGMYFLHGSIQVVVTELAPAARGSALAIHSSFFFFGQAAGPVFYGVGLVQFGALPVLTFGALVLAVVGLICSRQLAGAAQPRPR